MYPKETIEDQQINSMHEALERARAFVRTQSESLKNHAEFSIHLRKPRWVCNDDDSKCYCDAQVTVRLCTMV